MGTGERLVANLGVNQSPGRREKTCLLPTGFWAGRRHVWREGLGVGALGSSVTPGEVRSLKLQKLDLELQHGLLRLSEALVCTEASHE